MAIRRRYAPVWLLLLLVGTGCGTGAPEPTPNEAPQEGSQLPSEQTVGPQSIRVRDVEFEVPAEFAVTRHYSDCFDNHTRGVTCYQSGGTDWFFQRENLIVAVAPASGTVTRVRPLPMIEITAANAEEVGLLASLVRAIAGLPTPTPFPPPSPPPTPTATPNGWVRPY